MYEKSKRTVSSFLRAAVKLILSLWALLTVSFFIMHVIPGDPFQDEIGIPLDVLENLRKAWGLHEPLIIQYGKFLWKFCQFDFGSSIRFPTQTILGIISQGFPISLQLGLQALFLSLVVGGLIGTLSARYATHKIDVSFLLLSTFGISFPSFVLAAFLQYFFCLVIPIFPPAQWGSFSHSVLPTIALSIGPTCVIARILRASVFDTLSKEWVTTARMKGLPEWRVLLFHVLPIAFLPLLHYIGPIIANLLVGSFVIERIFAIPGLGQWLVGSILARDYPVIAGITLFYSLILFTIHAVIDVISAAFDARLSVSEGAR